jgi:hypothetical protein
VAKRNQRESLSRKGNGRSFGCNLGATIFQRKPRKPASSRQHSKHGVQLGCNKTSRGLLWAPKWAIGVNCQTVTSETSAVTAKGFIRAPPRPSKKKRAGKRETPSLSLRLRSLRNTRGASDVIRTLSNRVRLRSVRVLDLSELIAGNQRVALGQNLVSVVQDTFNKPSLY